jgi:predicted nuclease with TOPRIM domain
MAYTQNPPNQLSRFNDPRNEGNAPELQQAMTNLTTTMAALEEAHEKLESIPLGQVPNGIGLEIRDVGSMLVRSGFLLDNLQRRMGQMGNSLAGEHEKVGELEQLVQELTEKLGEKDTVNEMLNTTIQDLEKRNAGLKANIADHKGEIMAWLSKRPEIVEDDE